MYFVCDSNNAKKLKKDLFEKFTPEFQPPCFCLISVNGKTKHLSSAFEKNYFCLGV